VSISFENHMFRIILNILIFCIALGYFGVVSANDMTQPTFTIDLVDMDPLREADNII
jgi:hypothetical protein